MTNSMTETHHSDGTPRFSLLQSVRRAYRRFGWPWQPTEGYRRLERRAEIRDELEISRPREYQRRMILAADVARATDARWTARSRDCEHPFRTVDSRRARPGRTRDDDSQRRRAADRRARLHAALDRLLDGNRRAQDLDEDLELGDSRNDFEPDQRDFHLANLAEKSDRHPVRAADAQNDHALRRLQQAYDDWRATGGTNLEACQPTEDRHAFDADVDPIKARFGIKPWEVTTTAI